MVKYKKRFSVFAHKFNFLYLILNKAKEVRRYECYAISLLLNTPEHKYFVREVCTQPFQQNIFRKD